MSNIVGQKGVMCLKTALDFYGLTTQNHWRYHIAFPQNYGTVNLPDYPPARIFYFSEEQYQTGIEEKETAGNIVKIYDIEKTICDCFRLRNKIGIEPAQEALKEYVEMKGANISKLVQYAKKTRIESVVKKYLNGLLI